MDKNEIGKQALIHGLEKLFSKSNYLIEVHQFLENILKQGYGWQSLFDDLEKYMLYFRQNGQTEKEDMVLDALNFLDGWCAPNMSLRKYKDEQ